MLPEAGTKGFEDGLWESTPHQTNSFQGTSCVYVSAFKSRHTLHRGNKLGDVDRGH